MTNEKVGSRKQTDHFTLSMNNPIRTLQRRFAWHQIALLGIVSFAIAPLAGCGKPTGKPPEPKPVEVQVALPLEQRFTESEEFSGRLKAVNSIEIKAQVTGYLDAVLFEDGADVKPGTPLFKIDPRLFIADAERAAANITMYDAQIQRLDGQLNRAKKLVGSGAISQEEVEILKSQLDEAKASKKGAVAMKKSADDYVEYTEINAKISGRISRRLIDAHNMVKANETPLAVLVSLNPIHAEFDVDERTVLKIRRMKEETTTDDNTPFKTDSLLKTIVRLSLTDDREEYNLKGEVDFVDNQLDPSTGTLRVRAKIENPNLFLSPGMFVRCRLPIGSEKTGLFVPEQALGSDQGQSFLYVVNDENVVVYRRVQLGPLQAGKRAILSNLTANERVIVAGLQRVRGGTKVTPVEPKPDEPKSEVKTLPAK